MLFHRIKPTQPSPPPQKAWRVHLKQTARFFSYGVLPSPPLATSRSSSSRLANTVKNTNTSTNKIKIRKQTNTAPSNLNIFLHQVGRLQEEGTVNWRPVQVRGNTVNIISLYLHHSCSCLSLSDSKCLYFRWKVTMFATSTQRPSLSSSATQ